MPKELKPGMREKQSHRIYFPSLGHPLQNAREARMLTRWDVALASGVAVQHVKGIEERKHKPSKLVLDKLIKLYPEIEEPMKAEEMSKQATILTHVTRAEHDVLMERTKQRAKWGEKHDDEHKDKMLLDVAENLLYVESVSAVDIDNAGYGYCDQWGIARKNPEPRQRLVIAAALIIAEIERRDRAAEHADSLCAAEAQEAEREICGADHAMPIEEYDGRDE